MPTISSNTTNISVLIDGSSQGGAGYNGPPLITLNGGASSPGLSFGAGSNGNEVKDLVLQAFGGGPAITINGSNNNLIVGNYIGTNSSGTGFVSNNNGVLIEGGASGNTVGGTTPGTANLISGVGNGVGLTGSGTSNNVVEGNLIGTDKTGNIGLFNFVGVQITGGASGNTVGGTTSGAANVISASTIDGVYLGGSGTSNNVVEGNLIGTNLSGTAAIATRIGVFIADGASRNTVGGSSSGSANVISGNTFDGVYLDGSGTSNNVVLGNLIGTNISGTAPLGNRTGVFIGGGASGNTVGGTTSGFANVISGNTADGVYLGDNGTSNNVVQGNLIGTDITGTASLANDLAGVGIGAGATENTVGGTTSGAANVISGNTSGDGVYLDGSGTSNNVVQGNLIGTNLSGTAAIANHNGVLIGVGASGNTVGGTTSGSANVISGNANDGVSLYGGYYGESNNNVVQGNLIGTNLSGTAAIANNDGVFIAGGARGNTVGGTASGSANVISGNTSDGVYLGGNSYGVPSGNVVQGNLIGTDITGISNLGNTGDGVRINGATDNTIGGIEANSGNTIAFNAKGVVVVGNSSTGNSILGNSISNNTGLGIDLGDDGPTPNGANPRSAPNNGQNTPVLTSVIGTTVTGTLTSTASTTFRLEFFASPASGPAYQGQTFLGFTNVIIDPSGQASFTAAVLAIPANSVVTATATNLSTGDTSEFSPSATQGVGLPAGTIDVLSPTANGALNLSGNAQLAIPGVLTVDSSSASAITASGNASATATAINVVGGVQTSGNASLSPTPTTGAAAVADPFAGLAAPTFSGTGTAVNLGGNQALTLNPGTYSQITVSGNAKLTLTPGTYVITTGGFLVSGNASVGMSGSGGVLIYDAGGGIAVSGNATLNLSAETSGPYDGLVIFQARTNTRALNFSGNGVGGLSGTVYAAGAQVILSGNASLQNVSMVVNTLTLSGNAGAFQLADGSSSDYLASTSNQILVGALTVAVEDDTGNGIDPNELARLGDAMTYLNTALGAFGVDLTWAAPGTAADITVHFGSSTPYGGASAGVLGFTTAGDDVYLVTTGWDFYTGSDPSGIGSGQYDFQTLAEHELAHTVGLGESSDPQSVMYEYLSAGTVRRTFTDANLALIDTDADRFMKAAPDSAGAQPVRNSSGPVGGAGLDLGPVTPVPQVALVLAAPGVNPDAGPSAANPHGQLPPVGYGDFDATATSPLAAPPAVNPAGAVFTLTRQELPGQPDTILRGSSGVVVGGEGKVVLGGQAVQGGDPVSSGGYLDAHAEAVRQVVSEWSEAGSSGRLADLTAEDFFARPLGEEGRENLDLVSTPLTEADGGDALDGLPAPDLWGAALAVALLEASRLDLAGASDDRTRRWRR